MIWILLISLLLMAGIAYFINNQNILSPWVILCSVFSISTIFALINEKNWDFNLSPDSVLLILSALLCFGIAETLINYMFQEKKLLKSPVGSQYTPEKEIAISNFKIALLCVFMGVMLVNYFYDTYQLSLLGGNPGGLHLMLKYARDAQLSTGRLGRAAVLSAYFTKAVSAVFAYIFLYNTVFFGFKIKKIKYLLPLLMHFPFIVLSTGRTEFIYQITTFIVIWSICYQMKKGQNNKNTVKIIFGGIAALGIFFALFIVSGYLTGKSQLMSIYKLISFYTGSSIPAFDIYNTTPHMESALIGEHTLLPIYSVLRTLGFHLPVFHTPYEFVQIGGFSTNIYTAIRRYMQDYSITGMYIIVFLLGAFYSTFFNIVKNSQKAGLLLIIYAVYCFPLFEFSIEERFLTSIVSMGTIYQLFFIIVLYYILIHPKRSFKTFFRTTFNKNLSKIPK